jgi:hypothetical protein
LSGTISATVASLIAAAVGAAGVGTGLYESAKSSDQNAADQAAEKTALQQQQQAAANQANLSKQEAVLGAQGQAQQQTGGSLTDAGSTALTDLLAGYPGYQGGSSTTTSGGTSTTSANPTIPTAGSGSSTPDIAAILTALRGGGSGLGGGIGSPSSPLSGGNWQTQPAAPSTYFELANPPV